MRIAISGTHNTGKTSLVTALSEHLPQYLTVPEPYDLLEEDGYEFASPPTVDDYIAQLQQSILTLRDPAPDLIVDRSPLDFIGYIFAGNERVWFDLERWRKPITAAMESLDLIVVTRIDRANDPAVEDDALRRAVDDELMDIVADDALELCPGVDILSLDGPWELRPATVMTYLRRKHHSPNVSR